MELVGCGKEQKNGQVGRENGEEGMDPQNI